MKKYLLINDISYILSKRKKFFLLLLLPILFGLINTNNNLTALEILNLSFGTNLDVSNYSIGELLIYLFNIFFYVFLLIDIYQKDIEFYLGLIFLRINLQKWFVNKSIIFFSSVLLLKTSTYFITVILLLQKGVVISLNEIVVLFILDYLYIIMIQLLFLMIYLINCTKTDEKVMIIIQFLIILIFLPKNILSLRNNACLISLFCIFIFIICLKIIKKHYHKIIQNIGGKI